MPARQASGYCILVPPRPQAHCKHEKYHGRGCQPFFEQVARGHRSKYLTFELSRDVIGESFRLRRGYRRTSESLHRRRVRTLSDCGAIPKKVRRKKPKESQK